MDIFISPLFLPLSRTSENQAKPLTVLGVRQNRVCL